MCRDLYVLLVLLLIHIGLGEQESQDVPPLLSEFGAYPNVWKLQNEHRSSFAPVVIFPTILNDVNYRNDDDRNEYNEMNRIPNIQILDLTQPQGTRQLATEDERKLAWLARQDEASTVTPLSKIHTISKNRGFYGVGRYDERRIGLYVSDMFDDTKHVIEGFDGRRDVHMGLDLEGPLYTSVHAFTLGKVLHAGYNPELGDYGYVIVVEHPLPTNHTCYALYGHLDPSVLRYHPGDSINKGDVLGKMGDIHENGGWILPHVHFQVSVHAPSTHDMPGAVAVEDRSRALWEYPDPRYIVGPLY